MDPSLALQGALVARLTSDAALSALIGGRVYDQVPPSPVFPYITLGEGQTLPDRADCYMGSDVYLTLHAWSRAVGYPEVKRIAGAIRTSLEGADLALADHRLVDITLEDISVMRDPDGLTSHAVITFKALTEPV